MRGTLASDSRAIRTWQDQIKILLDNGFIKIAKVGSRNRYILIVHPTVVIERLKGAKKVSDQWLKAYNDLKRDTREPTYKQREEHKKKKEDERQKQIKMMRDFQKAHSKSVKPHKNKKGKTPKNATRKVGMPF